MMIYRDWQPESFFLGYQRDWIKDQSRLKLMEKGRQIGLSWCTAYALVRRKSLQKAKLDAWISSRDDLQARLFKEDCNSFASVLHAACDDLGEQLIDKEKNISAYVLSFANGCRIHSMSSNPDAQAGKRGDRVLDEFALHPDPRKLWSISYPGITWGGLMEIISTHRGSANMFNRLVQEIKNEGNPKGISLHTVTLQDALEYGFLVKLKAKLPKDDPRQEMDEAAYFDYIKAGCADEESFQQEYMCQPSDDASSYISYDLIDGNLYLPGSAWELPLERDKRYYLGFDVGRTTDLSVLWLSEAEGEHASTRRIIEMANTTFSEQERVLYSYLERPEVIRAGIDGSGIGRQLAERAQEKFGNKVEIVIFTSAVKEDLAVTTRKKMEDRQFSIPNNPKLIADFRSIRKETTSAGNVRYVGERTANGHADRWWAACLSLHAMKQPTVVMPRSWGGNGNRRGGQWGQQRHTWRGIRSL